MTKLAIAAVALIAAAVGFALLPVGDWIARLIDAIRGTGALGVVVFSAVLIATTVLLAPTVELFVAAGMIYGVVWGALLTTVVSLAGSLLAFALGRTVLRDRVAKIARKHEKLGAVDRALGDHAFWIATLLRLSPAVPLGPLNYVLAAGRISVATFVTSFVVGMLPGDFLWAYLGSALHSATHLGHAAKGIWSQVLLWATVAATIATSVLIGHVVKRAIDRYSSRKR